MNEKNVNKFSKEQIEEKAELLICDLLNQESLLDKTQSLKHLGLDNFDVIEITLLLEEWLEFCIDDEKISEHSTIKEVAELILEQKINSRNHETALI